MRLSSQFEFSVSPRRESKNHAPVDRRYVARQLGCRPEMATDTMPQPGARARWHGFEILFEVLMMRRLSLQVTGSLLLVLGMLSTLPGAEISHLIKAVQQLGNEAQGNAEAARAWKQLAARPVTDLPEILAGLDDANDLAANYLRGVVEVIADRELKQKGKLPVDKLEAFLTDTRHNPRARRLAFELIARVDPGSSERLIPGMLNDPSVELRRDAVERVLSDAATQLAGDKKEDAKKSYAIALGAARDDDQVQAAKKKLEELGVKVDLPRHFGFLMEWRLIAPFDNAGNKGFDVAYPPEKEISFDAEYEGKEGMKVGWTKHATDNEYGVVDLAKALMPYKGAVTYATTEFFSDREQAVDFRLGTPNSWKVWLNGELLFGREEYHRGMSLDQYRMRGTLKPGKNVILIKVCQNEQTEEWAQRWQFQIRVCDKTGTAILSANRAARVESATESSD